MNRIRLIFTLVITAFLFTALTAQDCGKKIEDAQALYNKGQFLACIVSIKSCRNSADERISFQANRLAALAYLGKSEKDSARAAAITMMQLNPRFKPSALRDPSDLIQLIETINIIPKFSLGMALSVGTSSSLLSIDNVFMVTDQTKTYKGQNNAQFSVSTNYQLSKVLSVGAMIRVVPKNYTLKVKFGNWDINSDESLTYLQLPLMLKYSPLYGQRLKPFVQAGGFAGRLLYTNNSFYAKNSTLEAEYSLVNISSDKRRNKFEYGICGGTGINYKIGEGQLVLQANYFRSMSNITISDERYDHPELLYSYYHLDDDMRIHNFSFSVGYSFFLNYKVLDK